MNAGFLFQTLYFPCPQELILIYFQAFQHTRKVFLILPPTQYAESLER